MYKKSIFFILLLCLVISSCKLNKSAKLDSICFEKEINCLLGKSKIELITNRGILIIELDGNSSPLTAANFLKLSQMKVYNGTIFHRVIRYPSSLIVQGGDPNTANSKIPKSQYGSGYFVSKEDGEAKFIPLEIKLKNEKKPRYNQLITKIESIKNIQLKHEKGSIAMARSGEVDSASSQFYITLRSLPELDGRYAVFGKVIKGFDVLELINEGDSIQEINLIRNR